MSICWGANDFGQGLQEPNVLKSYHLDDIPAGYDRANQTAYLDDMIRWTMDWLIKVRDI